MQLSRPRTTISSSWLIRALARSAPVHACRACASRMFVATHDGLCPVCRARQGNRDHQIARIVDHQTLSALSDW